MFGLGLGGEYMIIPLMAAELFGVRVLGRLMGVILTADGVAEATFALCWSATCATRPAATDVGFIVLIAIALAGTVAIAFLPRRGARRRDRRMSDLDRREFLATLGALPSPSA